MSKDLFIKIGYTDHSVVTPISSKDFQVNYASPDIIQRLEKFAHTVKAVAPRSDDFLYFTIIFLKAAEAALIDEQGNHKKIGNEKAWGYFDDKWKWHGNVKPHKNNNLDIFPESELKKASRNWIGRPLCVDHKSDSVDGIRGIILDTYYDERLKQVVGLCALDKINYPDLARKVQTGVVRYGSMGTAVSTSICSECGKPATTPKEYCDHILKRQAWGEINVGLNPIEYSLVVQPAEPGAILLRCIASIENHKSELSSYGLEVDSFIKKIEEKEANDLDLLLTKICGEEGCSIEQRQRIVKGYLANNGFAKTASVKTADYNRELLSDLARFEDVFGVKYSDNPDIYHKYFGDALNVAEGLTPASTEQLTSNQNAYTADTITGKDDQDVSDLTGTGSSGLVAGVSEPNPDSFKGDGVGPESYAFSEVKNNNIKLSSIVEEIMNESRLRKRASLRRRLAYPQGGSESEAEPKTFKDEGTQQNKIREQDDKHMHPNPTNLGGAEGMVPGDKEKKEKVLRAEENRQNGKRAYYQGATEGVEPSTFKSEDYHRYWDTDKHMHQTGSMGSETGMFPGDDKVKEQQKRAAYKGPALSTKFKQRRSVDGVINKASSCFEVYSGDKLVIAATAKDIFGTKVEENWDWITSKEYANAVFAKIRTEGLEYVGRLLTKKAQQLPEAAPAGGMPAELGDIGGTSDTALPELDTSMPTDEAPALEEGGEGSPKSQIEDALVQMEDTIEEVRTALGDLSGTDDVDVNINVGDKDADMPEDKLALSRDVFRQLKTVLAEAQESADELALLSETYDRYGRLTTAQKKDLRILSSDALRDYSEISGQSKVLISMAKTVAKSLVKTSEYIEVPVPVAAPVKSGKVAAEKNDLVSKAMELRKQRRQDLLKKAQEEMEEESCADDGKEEEEKETKENEAHDGIGMPENAPVAGVTKDLAADVAAKKPVGGEHKPAPSVGNQDAKQFDKYPSTNSRQLAEQSVTSVKQNAAEDKDMKKEDVKEENEAKDGKEEEVEKENEASDPVTPVQEKMATAFMKKKVEEEREAYRLKLRRAYNIAMEMQRKGMLASTKPALDRQVDNMMEFDDKAFESFKKSVAEFQGNQTMKIASDLNGINIGVTDETESTSKNKKMDAETLAALWE